MAAPGSGESYYVMQGYPRLCRKTPLDSFLRADILLPMKQLTLKFPVRMKIFLYTAAPGPQLRPIAHKDKSD